MKILKSIKWRLQIWYGLILVVVLAGFGFTAYELERGRLLGRIDDELHRRTGVLINALGRPPPHHPGAAGQPFDRPPPDQFPDDDPPGQNPRLRSKFNLRPEDAHFFDASDAHNFYFKIISSDGQEIARSTNQPNSGFVTNFEATYNQVNSISGRTANPPKVVSIENYRVTANNLLSGETIWIGCSIAPELKELRHTALNFAAMGGIILFFGLAGGWWIVSRSLLPVVAISSAAAKISAGDLSQRIDITEAESELGQLATVLNSTFARLEAAFAQQQQFASDAAHELRTPVSVMLTQTQTALNRERTAPEYREAVETCQRAAQRMRKLIESLLELARLDAGQEILKRLRFDFSKTISDCIELVKPLAAERGVKILVEISPIEISGDSERLAQVVTNLLTNAVQYNRMEGEVRVRLKSQDHLAILTVSDSGAGISAGDLPRIFERFYRADQSRSSGNAGLGLAISKAIVEAHGGTLSVSSEKNVGTIFSVRLST
jgi:two-component system, OmpR family, sensor kinase